MALGIDVETLLLSVECLLSVVGTAAAAEGSSIGSAGAASADASWGAGLGLSTYSSLLSIPSDDGVTFFCNNRTHHEPLNTNNSNDKNTQDQCH